MDVKTAFLNRELEEKIYITQPVSLWSRTKCLQTVKINIWPKTILKAVVHKISLSHHFI